MLPGIHSAIAGASKSPFTVAYLGHIDWSSGSTITGSIDIGVADPDKEIFLLSTTTSSTSRTLTAATTTVDSVAVTKATTEHLLGSGGNNGNVACAFVSMPTQSGSKTITATYSGAVASGTVFIFKVISRPGIGTNESDSSNDSGVGGGGAGTNDQLVFTSTTIPANGIWFACMARNQNATVTWNNGTVTDTRYDGTNSFETAYRDPQVSGSTPSDDFSWSGNCLRSGASWSFG